MLALRVGWASYTRARRSLVSLGDSFDGFRRRFHDKCYDHDVEVIRTASCIDA